MGDAGGRLIWERTRKMTKKKNKHTALVGSSALHMGCSVLCRRGLLECPGGPAVLAAPPTGLLLLARLLERRNIFRGELVVLPLCRGSGNQKPVCDVTEGLLFPLPRELSFGSAPHFLFFIFNLPHTKCLH